MKRKITAWGAGALLLALAAPAWGQAPEPQPGQRQPAMAPTPIRHATEAAIGIQTAIAAEDWGAAEARLAALRRQLQALPASPLPDLSLILASLETGIEARDPELARLAGAYVVSAMLTGLETVATVGGGGGGPAPEAQDDMDRLLEMELRGRDRPNQRGRQ